MIVFAHVASERGALINAYLGWSSAMRQYDEGIESNCTIDGCGGRVYSPPVIGSIHGCSNPTIDTVQIVAVRSSIASQPTEAHVNDYANTAAHINTAAARSSACPASGRVSCNSHFGQISSFIQSVIPEPASVPARCVIADDGTRVDNQTSRRFNASAIAGGVVSRNRACMNRRAQSGTRTTKSENSTALSFTRRYLRSVIVDNFGVIQDNPRGRSYKDASTHGTCCNSNRRVVLNGAIYEMCET